MESLKNKFHLLEKLGTEPILSYVHPMAIRCPSDVIWCERPIIHAISLNKYSQLQIQGGGQGAMPPLSLLKLVIKRWPPSAVPYISCFLPTHPPSWIRC